MNVQQEIKELTISFFKTIDAQILDEEGLYTIIIPEKYKNYFLKSKIQITFDEEVANENNCELIVPGSKTLYQIIINCNNKGPINVKKSLSGKMNTCIRYFFHVNFSGIKQYSQLFSIIVDLKNMEPIDLSESLQSATLPSDFKLDSDKITPSFDIALKELKKKSSELKSSFIYNANVSFETDFKLFVLKYDDEIRELDDSINKKETSLKDFNKIRDYRFDTLEKIKNLEKEKISLIESLQEKYKIDLNYELIACEIILC